MRQLKNFSSKSQPLVTDAEATKEYAQKYAGFSEEQLVATLVAQVKSAKQSGSYNEEQMQAFVDTISPQLSPAQKSKLENMLRLLETE